MFAAKVFKRILAAGLFVACAMLISGTSQVQADGIPVVEITAKRFAFSPDKITLKKGQAVKLRLHSDDVTTDFPATLEDRRRDPGGQTKEITVTPQTAGTFTTICDHFCGANHGNMNMTIVVE